MKREQYKRLLMFGLSLLALAGLGAAFAFVWYFYYSDIIELPFFRKGNWLVIGLYLGLTFFFRRVYSGQRVGYLKCGDVIYSNVLVILVVNSITYVQISLLMRRLIPPWSMLVLTVVDFLLIVAWAIFADAFYHRLYPPHRILMVYGSEMAQSLLYKIRTRTDKYDICELIHADEGIASICSKINDYPAVLICDVKSEVRNKLLKYCYANEVRTYFTPKISDLIIRGADSVHLFDTPLQLCRNLGLSAEQRIAKRILDLTVAVTALVVLSPILLITAAAIKLCDGGPIFYRQRRVTIGGREFDILKFRSMIVNAEKNGKSQPAVHGDQRITSVGRVIRATRVDELPQLLNILHGEMSIVGPRPERIEHVEKYTQEIPEFEFRHKVKAGLTGYAQVVGKYNTTAYDKLKMDLTYISTYSILQDIKLILMTVKILFVKESTEGFDVVEKMRKQ